MSTVVEQSGQKRVHIKGASEIVLDTCTHYLDATGQKKPIDDPMKNLINDTIKIYAKNALRTIAFAYKEIQDGFGGKDHDEVIEDSKIKIGIIEEKDNILIGLAGIMDIIREEVPGAVSKCNFAGVRVRMVTGDNKVTAIAIAKECGILA